MKTNHFVGNSATTTLTAAGPLTPGVNYEFWPTGHSSQGDGPESNHVVHTVSARDVRSMRRVAAIELWIPDG